MIVVWARRYLLSSKSGGSKISGQSIVDVSVLISILYIKKILGKLWENDRKYTRWGSFSSVQRSTPSPNSQGAPLSGLSLVTDPAQSPERTSNNLRSDSEMCGCQCGLHSSGDQCWCDIPLWQEEGIDWEIENTCKSP